jgi:ParB family chromosome partitioning protein
MSENLMTIPLCQLKRAALNVRKTSRNVDIGQLATSIEAHGLLENLVVRLVRIANGEAEPLYEVIAGGRRFDALKLLAKRHKITMDHPVPCRVLGESELVDYVEVSLAENIVRAPLHPADQFDAFAKLNKDGLSAAEIAARFSLPEKVVSQRLKLAAVSPRLMAAYRAEEMTLDQLMAFAITDDHAAQEAFWFDGLHGDRSSRAIRRHLTSSLVEADDRRALFVGTKAYEEAGGTVIRDLFQPESEGYFADSQLLDRLVVEKLEAESAVYRTQGWAWVQIMVETDYGVLSRYGRLQLVEVLLPEEEQKRFSELSERYDEIVVALEEQEDEAASAELDRIVEEMDRFEEKRFEWPEEGQKHAGIILSLTPDGELKVDAGLVRPEDRKWFTDEKSASSAETSSGEGEQTGRSNGYSDSLLTDLSAHKTAALREMLIRSPKVALAALVHRLAYPLFFERPADSCVRILPAYLDLGGFSGTVGESPAMEALLERHKAWAEKLPEADAFWPWLLEAEPELLLNLLVYCTALTLDAVYRRNGATLHMDEAGTLAAALSLDMTEWWQPTRMLFFDHLTKSQILEVVEEVTTASTAKYLTDLKKGDMAKRAEELLKDKRWLPTMLWTEGTNSDADTNVDAAE